MDPLLDHLQKNARSTPEELAPLFGLGVEEVASRIRQFEEDGTILGYQTVVDPARAGGDSVTAFIEVKLTPEREGGFDRMAQRIARFDQVKSCFLMSGGYDLSVIVTGDSLQDVAGFVSERLSTLDGVTSTATHFQLKPYKHAGFLARQDAEAQRLPVSP